MSNEIKDRHSLSVEPGRAERAKDGVPESGAKAPGQENRLIQALGSGAHLSSDAGDPALIIRKMRDLWRD